MSSPPSRPRQLIIRGITRSGRAFRPSDWAERLCGVMSPYRPGGARTGVGAHIGYSPLCIPRVIDGVKCVIVSEALRDVEPMAWDFVVNFARDNELQTVEGPLPPDVAA
ncbi:DUF3579 domain-containing protein [Azohydromonas sediminis]|uniref:DUF3579 domain-containing protein n=1 Tax=Azohydromonas sediminis TaxID=2259674 RepID=UPI000E6580F9|nr:DUF3579 domain-containing protein [Azohydromonas sediminis]